MKRITYFWLVLLGTAAPGCQPADELDCTDGVATLRRFTTLYATAAQPLTLTNLSRAQTVSTPSGLTVSLPTNAFLTPAGTAATGPVELRIRELPKPGDRVLANVFSLALDGRFLETGGVVQLTAWQGNTRLRVRPDSALTVQLPAPTTALAAGMSLWRLTPDSLTRWRSAGFVTGVPGPPRASYRFVSGADSLGWYHVARPWPADTGAVRTTVRIGAGAQTGPTRVYLVAHARNAVLPLLLPTVVDGALEWRQQNLPVGTDLTAVVLQLRDQQFYYGTQRATIGPNHRFGVVLEPLPPAEIARRINAL